MNNLIKITKAAAVTLSVFGFMGWFYIAMIAIFHLRTLGQPLTHFAPYPREDTFGAICYLVSMVSFFIWNLVKDEK